MHFEIIRIIVNNMRLLFWHHGLSCHTAMATSVHWVDVPSFIYLTLCCGHLALVLAWGTNFVETIHCHQLLMIFFMPEIEKQGLLGK
jgi:hypothetical protein